MRLTTYSHRRLRVLSSKLLECYSAFMTPVIEQSPEREASVIGAQWAAIGWFAVLVSICYWPILTQLVSQWNNDEYMSHGFFVPILSGYFACQKRTHFLLSPP